MRPGEPIGRYVVEGLLGRGGMADVYAALDTRLGRRVALKRLRSGEDDPAVARLLREARAAAAFEHPNAVTLYDVIEHEGEPVIAMELVQGKPLRRFVGDDAVPLPRRLRWLVDVARALGAAHRAGIVHRDVKPQNVMVRDDGVVKVLDFGIARLSASRETAMRPQQPTPPQPYAERAALAHMGSVTETGVLVGTPLYASPEQMRCTPLDGRSDQFSWAVMAYELVAGRLPWRGDDPIAVLAQVVSGEMPPLTDPRVPPDIEAILRRALSMSADERYPTMDDAADALEPLAEPAQSLRLSGLPPQAGGSVRPAPGASPPGSTFGAPGRLTAPSAPIPDATSAPETVSSGAGTVAQRGRGRAARWSVRGLATVGALSLAALFGAVVTGRLQIPNPLAAPEPALPGVDAVACRDAVVSGDGASPELAGAIGAGACVRLAVELDVEWAAPPPAAALDVVATLGPAGAEVALSLGGRSAAATGATPLEAAEAAAVALAQQLAPKALPAARVQAWGASDERGARRIERVWHRMVLRLSPDIEAELRRLAETDPRSAFTHAFRAVPASFGSPQLDEARSHAFALIEGLPAPRARAIEGTLRVLAPRSPADPRDGLNLVRQAFADAPEDPEIAGVCSLALVSLGATDEAMGVVEHLWTRMPTRSLFAMAAVMNRDPDRDLDRDRRYLERLHRYLPESRAWGVSVRHLVSQGRFDDARAAIGFGHALGVPRMSVETGAYDLLPALVDLAALEPARARAHVTALLGDPRSKVSHAAARVIFLSHLVDGHVVDAESALQRERERLRGLGNPQLAAALTVEELRLRRWLGRTPPPEGELDAVERALEGAHHLGDHRLVALRSEIAIARALHGRGGMAAARRVLAELEAFAGAQSAGARDAHDGLLVPALPLVRIVHGSQAAAKRWGELQRASFSRRGEVAFDAALALEEAGDWGGAERAYLLAMDPFFLARDPERVSNAFEAVAARVRLAAMYRAQGRAAEAAPLEAVVARAWAGADPGVAGAVRRLR